MTANGGFITKHAFGVYGTEPPADAVPARRRRRPRSTPSRKRVLCEEPDGEITIETWTAMHDRDGNPETGIVVGLLDDGRRAIGTTQDADAAEGARHRGPRRPPRPRRARRRHRAAVATR